MEVLISLTTADWLHRHHPEVVGIRTDHMNGLAKADLDLEAVAVKGKDLQRRQGQIGTEQEKRAAHQMLDDHEADQLSD